MIISWCRIFGMRTFSLLHQKKIDFFQTQIQKSNRLEKISNNISIIIISLIT